MNPMLKMIQLAAEKAGWDRQLVIEWDAGEPEGNPMTTIRIEGRDDDCTFGFGPNNEPFSTDWDIQMGDGSILTVSAEAAITAIEMWLNNHK